jgi:hypothetical protein
MRGTTRHKPSNSGGNCSGNGNGNGNDNGNGNGSGSGSNRGGSDKSHACIVYCAAGQREYVHPCVRECRVSS